MSAATPQVSLVQAPGKFFVASDTRLGSADEVPVYRAVPEGGARHTWFTALRKGVKPFGTPAFSVDPEDGVVYADGLSGPDVGGFCTQVRYSYLLMQRSGTFRVRDGVLQPTPESAVFGMTQGDRLAVDLRPGLYYVSVQEERGVRPDGRPRCVAVLGPFACHLDALVRVFRAKVAVLERFPEATWASFGTTRLDPSAAAPPEGLLNNSLLSNEDRQRLVDCTMVIDAAQLEACDGVRP